MFLPMDRHAFPSDTRICTSKSNSQKRFNETKIHFRFWSSMGSMSIHLACGSQLWVPSEHSSISVDEKCRPNQIKYKGNLLWQLIPVDPLYPNSESHGAQLNSHNCKEWGLKDMCVTQPTWSLFNELTHLDAAWQKCLHDSHAFGMAEKDWE